MYRGYKKCPICSVEMIEVEFEGILIDKCEDHGVWLDKGELQKLQKNILATKERAFGRQYAEGFFVSVNTF